MYKLTFSNVESRIITLLQVWELKLLAFLLFFFDQIPPVCRLLTMYTSSSKAAEGRGRTQVLWDKAIYTGPALTLWGWEIGVEGRLVNTAEIAAACRSLEKLETSAPMKEKNSPGKNDEDRPGRKNLHKNSSFFPSLPHLEILDVWVTLMNFCYPSVLTNESSIHDLLRERAREKVFAGWMKLLLWKSKLLTVKVMNELQYPVCFCMQGLPLGKNLFITFKGRTVMHLTLSGAKF